jgi:7-carboxy-7-deazaguanine synthase (Cx14CxxC type)
LIKGVSLYRVKEIFYSLQGEGHHAGRAAVFIRFSGCNLWIGNENGRKIAPCSFCDTDFSGADGILGGDYDAGQLAEKALSAWPGTEPPFVVCTGGEPMLQLDDDLTEALHAKGCVIAIETNGTLPVPKNLDWITVSPKAGAELRQVSGNELKLVFPQPGIDPAGLEHYAFDHFYIQPLHGPAYADALKESITYCLSHAKWKLSLQLHKIVGIK